MANSRKRTSAFKCFLLVLLFALTSLFMEVTKLFDMRKNGVIVQRSVNSYLSGIRNRTFQVERSDANTTVISEAELFTLQSNDTSKATGVSLIRAFYKWDRLIRERTLSDASVSKLKPEQNDTSPSVDKATGVSLLRAYYEWNRLTRERTLDDASLSELKYEQNDAIPRADKPNEEFLLRRHYEWDSFTQESAMNDTKHEQTFSECFELSVIPRSHKLTRSAKMVEVAYYEGHRKAWIYSSLFKKPQRTRFCDKCNFQTNHTIRVRLEKDAWNLKSYDIVMFPQDFGTGPISGKTWRKILTNAPSHQRRVYATFEGPFKLVKLKSKRRFTGREYHWSWTFNTKSEFTMPYGVYHPFMGEDSGKATTEARAINWAQGKTNLVAWMSSWTHTTWDRKKFVEKLSEFVPVHMYGKTYRKCPKGSQSCKEEIKSYKFYLALENSCCKEYISEKFWRTLDWQIVPIVVGASREDYERLAPPNSFIFVDDFKSLEDLANYIIEIDKNDTLYNEFFRWRTQGQVHQNYPNYRKVTRKIPPTWFYSCNAVCKVTERYLREKKEFVEPASSFDPRSNWWGRSCRNCGAQPYFEEFRT